MIRSTILIVLVVLLGSSPSAYADTSYWANTYGGTGRDNAWAVEQTSDLGYILAGQTFSFGSGGDVWIIKLTASGGVEWQRAYGGAGLDEASSVHQTPDGNYIVAGYTGSFVDPDYDMWVLKLDSSGGIMWEYAYGTKGNQDIASWVEQTSDGGYILGGRTNSGADAPDFWALKLDSNGGAEWDRTYSLGSGFCDRRIEAIHQTSDSGYILAGSTSLCSAESSVAWVIKTDAEGDVVWERSYDPGFGADVEDIRITSDGGYVLIAEASHTLGGLQDFWVLKLQSDGAVEWERTYGGAGNEDAQVIRQTSDGGYILGGATTSFGAGGTCYDFGNPRPCNDAWIVKLNENGQITWERTYGGIDHDDEADGIDQTTDGGYVVAGETDSFGAGETDMWVLRIDSTGSIRGCQRMGSSSAIVTDTTATIVDTKGTASSISETRTETDATITTTSLTPNNQCLFLCGLAQLAGFTERPEGSILMVIGDFALNPHGSKPSGVGYQQGRDTTPLGFVSGMLDYEQPTKFDTDTAWIGSNGRPIASNPPKLIFSIGGPGINAVTHYYESTDVAADMAPVKFGYNSTHFYWMFTSNGTIVPGSAVLQSSTNVPPGTSDVFVIQILEDADGRLVVLMYGTRYTGTWAAARTFKYDIYPWITSWTDSYYIVRWTDVNADSIPSSGLLDTYTILAQG